MSKTLILVRHAHRDKTHGRLRDNGISAKGKKQVDVFNSHWRKKLSRKSSVTFLSSPKRRCIQTVEPLATGLGLRVRLSPLLEEQRELLKESPRRFHGRVKRFLDWWRKKGPKVTVACSHGDWIPEFLKLTQGKAKEISKGAWVVVQE